MENQTVTLYSRSKTCQHGRDVFHTVHGKKKPSVVWHHRLDYSIMLIGDGGGSRQAGATVSKVGPSAEFIV